jgi:hypothetical protein
VTSCRADVQRRISAAFIGKLPEGAATVRRLRSRRLGVMLSSSNRSLTSTGQHARHCHRGSRQRRRHPGVRERRLRLPIRRRVLRPAHHGHSRREASLERAGARSGDFTAGAHARTSGRIGGQGDRISAMSPHVCWTGADESSGGTPSVTTRVFMLGFLPGFAYLGRSMSDRLPRAGLAAGACARRVGGHRRAQTASTRGLTGGGRSSAHHNRDVRCRAVACCLAVTAATSCAASHQLRDAP